MTEIKLINSKSPRAKKLGGVLLALSHENGLEGQNAYIMYCEAKKRIFQIEFIQYPNHQWAYHIEDRKERLIADSRISEVYFPTFYQVQQTALKRLSEYCNK
jgi:hypothetical protein